MSWVRTEIQRMFGRITPVHSAANELAEAELALLRHETGQEFSAAMVEYNQKRVKRLRAFLVKNHGGVSV